MNKTLITNNCDDPLQLSVPVCLYCMCVYIINAMFWLPYSVYNAYKCACILKCVHLMRKAHKVQLPTTALSEKDGTVFLQLGQITRRGNSWIELQGEFWDNGNKTQTCTLYFWFLVLVCRPLTPLLHRLLVTAWFHYLNNITTVCEIKWLFSLYELTVLRGSDPMFTSS